MLLALAISLGLSDAVEAAFAHCEDECETACETECDLDCLCINCVHSKLTFDLAQDGSPVVSGLLYSANIESRNLADQAWSFGIDRPPQEIL